jgi:hypothetical protein
VRKLDLPCKDADSAATADVTAYGTDHAEKLRDSSSWQRARAHAGPSCADSAALPSDFFSDDHEVDTLPIEVGTRCPKRLLAE